MERREFITTTTAASIAAASAIIFGNLKTLFASNSILPENEKYDLVAVMNGEPGEMFDAAIESMGGMQTFVKKGQTVVVKPNIGWDVVPEKAANPSRLTIKNLPSWGKQNS